MQSFENYFYELFKMYEAGTQNGTSFVQKRPLKPRRSPSFNKDFMKYLYCSRLLSAVFGSVMIVSMNLSIFASEDSPALVNKKVVDSVTLPELIPEKNLPPGACGSKVTVRNASAASQTDGSLTIANLSNGSRVRVISVRHNFDTGMHEQNFPYTLDNLRPGLYAIQVQSNGCSEIKTVAVGPCGQVLIDTVQVSGCYPNNGSKATVSVQLSWVGAADSIAVQVGTQTKYIKASVGTSADLVTPSQPTVLAFEVPADGSAGTVRASFVSHPECGETLAAFSLPFPCESVSCTGLGGIVFNDYNGNGSMDSKEVNGIRGVVVKAYSTDGSVFSTFTDIYGHYTMNIPSGKYPLRVEFTNIPDYLAGGTTTPVGNDSRSTVQFVATPDCRVNIGVNNLNDFCQADPLVVIPCWVRGDPLSSSANSSANPGIQDALVAFPNSNRGVPERAGNAPVTHLALAAQVGTLWGAAYNKYTRRLFTSAVLRRHTGLGPLGLGGIYVSDMTKTDTSATRPFVDVATLGIDVGSISGRQLTTDLNSDDLWANRDSLAFFLVGKVGMGDLEISEDGNTLWFVNLKDKKLYAIDISAYNANGITLPTAADVESYAIPNPECAGGEMRPWGTKIREGRIYVGVVCDGSASGQRSDMAATIYQFDPTLGSGPGAFTPIFRFPLTYPKGSPHQDPIDPATNGWFTWSDDFQVTRNGEAHPAPFVADIEFDIDGSMVLSLGDRTSLQMGGDIESSPDGNSTSRNFVAGDILRVSAVGGAFVLENNAKAGPNTGSSPGNYQGPGFGEFYNDDWYFTGGTTPNHTEIVIGGMAIRPGSGEVVVATMDPLNGSVNPLDPGDDSTHTGGRNIWWSGGIRYLDNATGNLNKAYVLYESVEPPNSQVPIGIQPASFFKSSGLGDIEFVCDNVSYLEIGNRAWLDLDSDGAQDASEPPLPGLNVALYQTSDGSLIKETTTNAQGEYYFSASAGITKGTAYNLVFGSGQFVDGKLNLNGNSYLVTRAHAGQGTAPGLNDSDIHPDSLTAALGGMAAGLPFLKLRTGPLGYVNHTLDVGFIACPVLDSIPAQEVCYGTPFAPVGTSVVSGGKPTYQWFNDRGPANPVATPLPGAIDSVLTQLPTEAGIYRYKVIATTKVGSLVCSDSMTVELKIKARPEVQVDSVVCSPDRLFYSVYLRPLAIGSVLSTTAGVALSNVITGIASGVNVSMNASLNGCSTTLHITAPNCDCPVLTAPVSLGDKNSCAGQPLPVLAVEVLEGQSVLWYDAPLGGRLVAAGSPQFQPASAGTYYAVAARINGTDTCYSPLRTVIKLTTNPQPRIGAITPEPRCQPGALDLKSVVVADSASTVVAFGYPRFYTSAADAYSNRNALSNTLLIQPVSGRYWIRWQTTTGCFDTTSVQVVIHPRPTIRVLAADCAPDAKTYSIRYAVPAGAVLSTTFDNTLGVKVLPGIITGIPIRQAITLLATSPSGCTDVVSVASPGCPCPPIGSPQVATADTSYCEGGIPPSLSASITDASVTGDIYWYNAPAGGDLLFVGNPFVPSQQGTYYAEARDTVSLCISSARIPVRVAMAPRPVLTILDTTCAPGGLTYEVGFDTLHTSTLWISAGMLDGKRVKAVPQGQILTIRASNMGCTVTDTALVSCIIQPFGSIGNLVWLDSDGNGLQDVSQGELLLDSVKVQLLNEKGQVLRETFTASGGKYLFDSLSTGHYQIRFFKLNNFVFTPVNKSDSEKNSDADSVGRTALIFIDTSLPESDKGRNNSDVDAGLRCPPPLCIPISVRKVRQP
jgi:hypothetical protein